MTDEILESVRIRKVEKSTKERQKDEEWVGRELGKEGLDVYNRMEGERTFGEIEREVLLRYDELGEVFARMQGNGMISAQDAQGNPFEFQEKFAFEGACGAEERTLAEHEEIEETRKRVSEIWGSPGLRIYDAVEGEAGLEDIAKKSGAPREEAGKIVREMEREGVLRVERGNLRFFGIRPAKYMLNLGKSALLFGRFCGGPLSPLVLLEGVLRFGLSAAMVYKRLKKGADASSMAAYAKVGVDKVSRMLVFFERRGIARLVRATRKQVRGIFGEKGAAIYEKFGAAGLNIHLLYQKGTTPTEIIRRSGVSPKRAIEAIVFINGLYGVRMDKEKMKEYERYGIELEQS